MEEDAIFYDQGLAVEIAGDLRAPGEMDALLGLDRPTHLAMDDDLTTAQGTIDLCSGPDGQQPCNPKASKGLSFYSQIALDGEIAIQLGAALQERLLAALRALDLGCRRRRPW